MSFIKKFLEFIISKLVYTMEFKYAMDTPLTDLFASDTTFANMVSLMIPVGIGLAVIYLMKELLEKTSLKNIDLEQIVKLFIKLLIVFALINNSYALFKGMNTFCCALVKEMSNTILAKDLSTGSTYITDMFNKFSGSNNFTDILGTSDTATNNGVPMDVITAAIVVLGRAFSSLILAVVVAFVGFTRTITICYKTIYAPIAMANIVGYSTRNAAISYCKEMFALFMQYPIAYIGYAVAMSAYSSTYTASLTGLAALIAPIVLLALSIIWVSRSSRISKEMFC